ncbi:MAG: Hsp70 family protein [Ignavibacteria bacterium]|nr:Hsp70 family protein [Ignavibacteria bacterium]
MWEVYLGLKRDSQIEVTFDIDARGILNVAATDKKAANNNK